MYTYTVYAARREGERAAPAYIIYNIDHIKARRRRGARGARFFRSNKICGIYRAAGSIHLCMPRPAGAPRIRVYKLSALSAILPARCSLDCQSIILGDASALLLCLRGLLRFVAVCGLMLRVWMEFGREGFIGETDCESFFGFDGFLTE